MYLSFAFGILQRFFRFFEFTWNIADRLQFGEMTSTTHSGQKPSNEYVWSTPRLSLENYLQEAYLLKNVLYITCQENYTCIVSLGAFVVTVTLEMRLIRHTCIFGL